MTSPGSTQSPTLTAGSSARFAYTVQEPSPWFTVTTVPGDVIGAVGATALCESGQGTHLHFAIYVDGSCVDPLIYLPA